MKKFLILFLAALVLLSGCTEQRTVKRGDKVSIDYTGSFMNGTVFATTLESVAKENNLSASDGMYKPYNFTVGQGGSIQGIDEGVIGMKIGETRNLTIPPEKAYGKIDPRMIQTVPVIQDVSAVDSFPKTDNVSMDQFENVFGPGHKKGDVVRIPQTNINLTILNISKEVSIAYNLKEGDKISSPSRPWNQTVTKIDDKNITARADVRKNEIVRFPTVPWNSTVINVSGDNITLRHNAIPDTEIPTMFGTAKVSFNETYITIDQNHPLAGKTLVFKVTIRSIDEVKGRNV